MNWRKDWRKGICTLLIVTAEAHRVYDATHPRTRTQEPRAAGGDEQLFVSKTKCLSMVANAQATSMKSTAAEHDALFGASMADLM